MASTQQELHSLSPDAIANLYEIDLNPIGTNRIFRFVDSVLGGVVQFRGQDYIPWDMAISGIKISSDGPLPRPTVTLANYENTIMGLLDQYDPAGALFTRRQIFARHLDGGSDPDSTREFTPEIYDLDAYTLGDECQLLLGSIMARLNSDWPTDRIAHVRGSALRIKEPEVGIPDGDTTPPTVDGTFPDVRTTIADYPVTLVYRDTGSLVRYNSINDADIKAIAPDGSERLGLLIAKTPGIDSSVITARYRFVGPFGQAQNGAWQVLLTAGQVTDTEGNVTASDGDSLIGEFTVAITDTTPPTIRPA